MGDGLIRVSGAHPQRHPILSLFATSLLLHIQVVSLVGVNVGSDNTTKNTKTNLIRHLHQKPFRGLQFSSHSGIRLVNAGTLQGKVFLEGSNETDVIINRAGGVIQGDVLFGTGSDPTTAWAAARSLARSRVRPVPDTFFAGRARELFIGGDGADTFVYRSSAFSPVGANHDIISVFDRTGAGHDHIDVSAMDADATHAGRQHLLDGQRRRDVAVLWSPIASEASSVPTTSLAGTRR